ncbi:MAG TPA: hypothetical protein VHF07_03595, partial [Nitrospiraceae bacterium]|nr:hypothetical protein [Nitrospiraceae bacterium]
MLKHFRTGPIASGILGALMLYGGQAFANSEVETAELLIKLLQSGRAVISEHQALINDASKANKGFTGDFVAGQVIDRFRKQTRIDLNRPTGLPQAGLLLALVESEKEVVDEAQPVI